MQRRKTEVHLPRPPSHAYIVLICPRLQVKEAAHKEWEEFREERSAGLEEITELRQRVAEQNRRSKTERTTNGEAADDDGDAKMAVEGDGQGEGGDKAQNGQNGNGIVEEANMDVDEGSGKRDTQTKEKEQEGQKEKSVAKDEKKIEVTPTPGPDDDDAVEY